MADGGLVLTIMVGGDRFPEAAAHWTEHDVRARVSGYLDQVLGLRPRAPEPAATAVAATATAPSSVAAALLTPSVFTVNCARDCIPQPAPGHVRAVQGLRSDVATAFGYCDLTGLTGEASCSTGASPIAGSTAGWEAGPRFPADLLTPTSALPPALPLSLAHTFVLPAGALSASASTGTSEYATPAAQAATAAVAAGGEHAPALSAMASNLYLSSGLLHPRVSLLGTAVTGPAVKDLVKDARFAALRLARHLRAQEHAFDAADAAAAVRA
jgi:hypothetical protein